MSRKNHNRAHAFTPRKYVFANLSIRPRPYIPRSFAANIKVSGLHLEKSPKAKEYALKKADKLLKFHPAIEKIHIRLIFEKSHRGQENDYYCEITIATPHHTLEIRDVERDFGKAIDRAIDRMERTLTKHKEKNLTKKHREGLNAKRELRKL